MIFAETYRDLMTNPAHILFELSWEAISALAAFPFGRWYQRRHDAKVHHIIDREK